jgi:hypothetical protein
MATRKAHGSSHDGESIGIMALAQRLGEVSNLQDQAGGAGIECGFADACEAEINALEQLILARRANTLHEAAVQLALVYEEIHCFLEPGERFDPKVSARRLGRVITSAFAAIQRETLIDLPAILHTWAGRPDSPFPSATEGGAS